MKRTSQSNRRPELDGVKFTISNTLPNAYQLKHEIIEQLVRGDLDSGTPIVPITLDVIKINKGGNLVKGKLTTRGRTYSLQKIMDRLLHIHEKAGNLCDPFPLLTQKRAGSERGVGLQNKALQFLQHDP